MGSTLIEEAVRRRIREGDVLEGLTGSHVVIQGVNERGLSLREGPRQAWRPLSWECLQLAVEYLSHGRWVNTNLPRRSIAREKRLPSCLRTFLHTKDCLKGLDADWVARILFVAGIADIDTGPPERVRLEPAFLEELRKN